ncbi:12284_t:CDS:2, partial [Dentiscutata erythropus]
QSSNNEKSKTWVDLGDLIEISKISLNNSNMPIDYLQNYKENDFIDLDLNNFSNIKIKIVENDIIFSKKNFNKLIDIIINQTNQISQQKSFSTQLQLLTKTLYKYEDKNNDYLLDSDCFKQLIETEESQLIGFLDEMTNALVPKRRTEKNKKKAQQKIISQYYLLAGLRNQNINKYKTNLSLYLSSCGLSSTGIDFLMRAGITI